MFVIPNAPVVQSNGSMNAALTDLISRIEARQALPEPEERRRIRLAVRASQAACADALGVTRHGFAHWEAGSRTPRGDKLTAYLELLDALKAAAVPK